MLSKLRSIIVIALMLQAFNGFSQARAAGPKWEPEDAEEHFKQHNFIMALPMFKELVKREPENMDYNYKLGYCYLNTFIDKTAAVPYFEKVVKDPKCKNEYWMLMGRAYHLANKFDAAIKAYSKYKELIAKDKNVKETERADHLIDQCHNAQQLTKYPIKVTFTNAGPDVNSEFPDYYPWITWDEQQLFFTSRRKGGHTMQVESDGYYSSDCFMSAVLDGKWDKAKNVGNFINTNLDEQIVGIKPDGNELVVYVDHITEVEDLYISKKKLNGYSKLEKFSENVNNQKEYSGSIFETEDGPILYFVRNDKTSLGETDIYTARLLPNGQWGLPKNMGPNINTKYREDFPWLSADGKTFYFSSEGHSSMGGFDLFKCVWDEFDKEWSKPINLGYPLNTSDDERQISILPDNRAGYMSALRPGGLGGLDIYRVKFEDNDQKFSVFRGKITRSDSLVKKDTEATITALNTKTNEEQTFIPNKINGRYIMALLPGNYKVKIQVEGYKDIDENIVVFEFGVARPETVKNYVVMKK
ncbi:MAG: tetratricopeptide repeat protein [Bacteroidia bacterium]